MSRSLVLYAALWALPIIILAGCDESFCARGKVASIDPFVAFSRRARQGYELYSPSGSKVFRAGREKQSVLAFTPDLSGFAFIRVDTLGSGASRFSLHVQLKGGRSKEALTTESEGSVSAASARFEVAWGTADGTVFFVRDLGTVLMFSECGLGLRRQRIADDVQAFAISEEIFFTSSILHHLF